MEINKHVGFSIKEDAVVRQYLISNSIPFEDVHHCFFLDIYESNPHWKYISKYVTEHRIPCISETVFSSCELANAQWIHVRSKWRNGYPQPENGFAYEDISYFGEKACLECGAGLVQKDSFRIKKVPNWGRRHFLMLNWVEDELFVDDTAKSVLEKSNLKGIEFRNVKSKNGLEILPNINQLFIPTILPEGIVTGRRSIDKINKCVHCGVIKYHPTGIGMQAFERHIFDDAVDVVKTGEVFGWGHIAPRMIIMSQKAYQTITLNKLDRDLVFAPLELV